MKTVLTHTRPAAGATSPLIGWFIGALALLALLAAAPPFLGEGARALVMGAFAPLCHQFPDRSFLVQSVPFALCHRCTGIVLGLLAGLVASGLTAARGRALVVLAASKHAGLLLAVAFVPMGIDWGLDSLGVWVNNPASRLATGVWAGAGLGSLLASSLLPPLEDVGPGA